LVSVDGFNDLEALPLTKGERGRNPHRLQKEKKI